MTPEQTKLLALIDGHYAAMRAQVDDPGVRLEYNFTGDGRKWDHVSSPCSLLSSKRDGPIDCFWHRLAPVPRMVDLDQSDFLGPNRVTHLKARGYPKLACNAESEGVGYLGGYVRYDSMHAGWECSRDGGATFGPCSKPALTVAEAQQRHVCRVCGKPAVTASVDNALVLDYGKEFAHEQCLKREKASV